MVIKKKIRDLFDSVLLPIVILIARVLHKLLMIFTRINKVVVCPTPSLEDIRGDEALLCGCLEYLNKLKSNEIHVVLTGTQKPAKYLRPLYKTLCEMFYPIFLTKNSRFELISFMFYLINKSQLILIGADLLDGQYGDERALNRLNVVEIAGRIGVKSRVVSTSFCESPNYAITYKLKTVEKHSQLYIRDPISVSRLKTVGITNIAQTMDIAFLMKPKLNDSTPLKYVIDFANESSCIAINISPTSIKECVNGDLIIKHFVITCRSLIKYGYKILLIAHNSPYDNTPLGLLYSEIKNEEQCLYISTPPPATDVKYLMQLCHHVFSSRMHLAIACLGVGTPVSVFPYGGKFSGLFNMLEMEEAVINKIPKGTEEFSKLVNEQLIKNNCYRNKIKDNETMIMDMAIRNFI